MARYQVLISLAIISGLLVLALGIGFAAGRYGLPACAECVDPVEQYYRGIYDTCVGMVMVTGIQVDCLGMAGNALAADFYGTPSPGWRWPLPEAGEVAQ